MADINHKLENKLDEEQSIQRPKKQLSEAKLKAMEKMRAGREAWLKEKQRCKEEGLPPPVSKSKMKKEVVKEVVNELPSEVEDTPQPQPQAPAPLPKPSKSQPKRGKKQVVINNYYEEIVPQEEEYTDEESSDEEEVVNNHYRRYTNNPNPQYNLASNQKVIRFV